MFIMKEGARTYYVPFSQVGWAMEEHGRYSLYVNGHGYNFDKRTRVAKETFDEYMEWLMKKENIENLDNVIIEEYTRW